MRVKKWLEGYDSAFETAYSKLLGVLPIVGANIQYQVNAEGFQGSHVLRQPRRCRNVAVNFEACSINQLPDSMFDFSTHALCC